MRVALISYDQFFPELGSGLIGKNLFLIQGETAAGWVSPNISPSTRLKSFGRPPESVTVEQPHVSLYWIQLATIIDYLDCVVVKLDECGNEPTLAFLREHSLSPERVALLHSGNNYSFKKSLKKHYGYAKAREYFINSIGDTSMKDLVTEFLTTSTLKIFERPA